MDASTALKKAQALATRSLGSSDVHIQHLLTLPTYHSQTLNEYYAKSISRDFSEFEEYQDQAVDAILDLCEDENEQTRISGIKALAEIGKVEPKWVRGNTGVLVQLLECRELVHVKKALFDLLEVSPSDVFSMMAEDVKSSEEESGRNILNFLLKDASTQRKAILESGENIEAENIFSSGFYEVLPSSKEPILILELLGTLSTISGRNATRETMGRYAKALTKYTTQSTAMRMWDSFTKKAVPDPRWTIYFLATHGGTVVKAAMDDDRVAKRILEFYITESQSRWRRIIEDRDEKDLGMRALLPKFATTMIEAIISHRNTNNTQILELSVHCIYTILTLSRSTRDTIPKNLSRKLQDFADFANRKKKDSRGIRMEDGWRGVRDMVDTLWDSDLRVQEFRLRWSERARSRSPVKPPPSTSKSVGTVTHGQHSTPRQQVVPPSGPSRPALPPPAPAQAAAPPSAPSRPLPTSAPRPVPIERPATPPSPAAKVEPAPFQRLNIKSKATAPVTQRPTQPPLNIKSNATVPAAQLSVVVAETIVPLQASTPSLSIRARASLPPNPEPKEGIPSPAVPTSQGLSIRSASSTPLPKSEQVQARPISLLSRLAPSSTPNTPTTATPTNKRSRAEDFTPTSNTTDEVPRKSLADRLGGSDKKQRVASNPEIGAAPSLLSRMSQSQNSIHSDSKPAQGVHTGFTINRTAQPSPAPASGNGLSIKRSAPPSAPPIPSPGGFSIKNRSTSSTSTPTGFKIKREPEIVRPQTQSIPVKAEVEDDAPIVRKGRGFAARGLGDGELLITPPNPVFKPSGRLQDRLSKFGPRG